MTEELDQVHSWDLWECSDVMKPLGWVPMANEQHMVVTSKKKMLGIGSSTVIIVQR